MTSTNYIDNRKQINLNGSDTCMAYNGEYQDIHDACRRHNDPCDACEVTWLPDPEADMAEFANICRAEAAQR
jgi:hypothetical protein